MIEKIVDWKKLFLAILFLCLAGIVIGQSLNPTNLREEVENIKIPIENEQNINLLDCNFIIENRMHEEYYVECPDFNMHGVRLDTVDMFLQLRKELISTIDIIDEHDQNMVNLETRIDDLNTTLQKHLEAKQ